MKSLPDEKYAPCPSCPPISLPRQHPHWFRFSRSPQWPHVSHESDAPGLTRQPVGVRIWPSALHMRANADGLLTRTGPLEAGVVVFVTVLVRGTRMQLRHCARPLSNRHSTGVLSVVTNQLPGPEVFSAPQGLNGPIPGRRLSLSGQRPEPV
jgi:hypothetical protein